jgi:hypothetical protein
MTFPASDVVRTNADAGTDSPATFRTDALDLIDKFNLLRNHFSALAQTLINRSTAALMRTDLGAAASGANADITSLTTLTAGGLPDNSVLTADIANAAVTPAKLSQPLTLGTSVATTSGTAIDVTGIPSWAKRITISFNGVSTNGTDNLVIQVGSGSIATTGYVGSSGTIRSSAVSSGVAQTNSVSFNLVAEIVTAYSFSGTITLVHMGSNLWVQSGVLAGNDGSRVGCSGGSISLGGALDRFRLTTSGGANTFDAGSINSLYE